jgi:hypothetical protein
MVEKTRIEMCILLRSAFAQRAHKGLHLARYLKKTNALFPKREQDASRSDTLRERTTTSLRITINYTRKKLWEFTTSWVLVAQ